MPRDVGRWVRRAWSPVLGVEAFVGVCVGGGWVCVCGVCVGVCVGGGAAWAMNGLEEGGGGGGCGPGRDGGARVLQGPCWWGGVSGPWARRYGSIAPTRVKCGLVV